MTDPTPDTMSPDANPDEIVQRTEAEIAAFQEGTQDSKRQHLQVTVDGEECTVELFTYSEPQPPYTHWYRHPVSGDPIPVCLKTRGGVELELDAEIMGMLSRAYANGNFAVCVAWIEDGKMQLYRQTLEFPHAMFEACADEFRNQLRREHGPPEPKKPMQVAELPPINDPMADQGA